MQKWALFMFLGCTLVSSIQAEYQIVPLIPVGEHPPTAENPWLLRITVPKNSKVWYWHTKDRKWYSPKRDPKETVRNIPLSTNAFSRSKGKYELNLALEWDGKEYRNDILFQSEIPAILLYTFDNSKKKLYIDDDETPYRIPITGR